MIKDFIRFDEARGAIVFTKDCPQFIRNAVMDFETHAMTKRCGSPEALLAAAIEKRPDGTRIGQYIVQKIGVDNLHKIDNELLIEKLGKR